MPPLQKVGGGGGGGIPPAGCPPLPRNDDHHYQYQGDKKLPLPSAMVMTITQWQGDWQGTVMTSTQWQGTITCSGEV